MYSKYNCIYPDDNLAVYADIDVSTSIRSISTYIHRYFVSAYDSFCGVPFETAEDFWDAIIAKFDDEIISADNRLKSYYHYVSLAETPNISQGSHVPTNLSCFSETTYNTTYYSYYSLDKLNDNLSTTISPDSLSLFPIATRSIINENCIVVERSPFKISGDFKTSGSYRNGRMYPYEIWIPWTLTIIDKYTRRVVIYFSSEPADSPTARYIPCVLPNIYADGSVCFNSSLENADLSSDDDFRDYFFKVINEYYSGGWNTDLYSSSLKNLSLRDIESKSFAYRNFLVPEYSHYKNKYTPSKFKSLTSRNDRFLNTYSTSMLYKYFFEVLSTYDLKNTLDFYDDLIDSQPSSQVKSYQEIINISSNTINNYNHTNLFANLRDSSFQSNLISESYPSDFPVIKIFNTNSYYPYVSSLHKRSLEEQNFNYNSIINTSLNSEPLEDPLSFPAIQEICAKIFYNYYHSNRSLTSNVRPVFYFSYDHKENVINEYHDFESYSEYVENYINTYAKELIYAN